MTPFHSIKFLFEDIDDYQSFLKGQEASYVVIAALYGVITLAVCAVALADASPLFIAAPLYLLAFVVIGWAQYSIGNGMHEAVHKNFGNKNGDLLASILTAYPIGLTMRYRETHIRHHRFVGDGKDPDYVFYRKFPSSKIAMIKRFCWYVSGIPAVRQFIDLQNTDVPSSPEKKTNDFLGLVAVQLVILLLFFVTFGDVTHYILFWMAPIATIGKLLSSTRLLCEHGSPHDAWVVRSIDGPRWQTWALGAFDFNYHAEHHIVPRVPYAKLQALHRRNRRYAEGHPDYKPFDGHMEFYSGGYLGLLAKWFTELPWTQSRRPSRTLETRTAAADFDLEHRACVICKSDEADVAASGGDYLHRTSGQTYTYVECRTCGHTYLDPRPRFGDIARLYPLDYATYTKRFAESDSAISKVKDRVLMGRFKAFAADLPKNVRVLDIGCGDARFLMAVRREFADAELYGADWHFGPEVEQEARRARIETIAGAIEDMNLPEDYFDVITMNQLIEHVWDVDLVLRRCRRALKSGGLLAIETPNPDGWDRRFFKSGAWGGYYWPRHLDLFSGPNLKKIVERNGFEVVRRWNLLAPPCWIYSIQFSAQRLGAGDWIKKVFADNNVALLGGFAVIDWIAKFFGATTSNQKLIARKI